MLLGCDLLRRGVSLRAILLLRLQLTRLSVFCVLSEKGVGMAGLLQQTCAGKFSWGMCWSWTMAAAGGICVQQPCILACFLLLLVLTRSHTELRALSLPSLRASISLGHSMPHGSYRPNVSLQGLSFAISIQVLCVSLISGPGSLLASHFTRARRV